MASTLRPAALVLLVGFFGSVPQAAAQSAVLAPIASEGASRGGRIEGIVLDQKGTAIVGVSVVAMGTAMALVRTDAGGRFRLSLPPGEYVLRAAREGYISTYREPVRVQMDLPLRREIRLTRAATHQETVLLAGALTVPQLPDAVPVDESEHAHTEAAWRLRHLAPSVLRDLAAVPDFTSLAASGRAFDAGGSLVDSLAAGSVRAATSFFMDTPFTGQVNFITSSAVPASGVASGMQDWPRGIAYAVVGVPVGGYGQWTLRAAAAPGDVSSWTLLTEYSARTDSAHAFRAGLAYSAQTYLLSQTPAMAGSGRRVGGVYGFDRWTVAPDVVVDYGVKLDRYDYLATPTLVSARLGVNVGLLPGLRFLAVATPRMIAPGAEEFLPPSAAGPWLPPERTFSSLAPPRALAPERVNRFEVGVEAALGDHGVLSLQRFSEFTRDQIVTIFGLDAASQVGHYYVSNAGTADVDGWRIGLSGRANRYISGSLHYSVADVRWTPPAYRSALLRASPSSLRAQDRIGMDLTASVDADVPQSATHLKLSVRLNNDYSGPTKQDRLPIADGRFKIELRQQLPYRPWTRGELNFVVALRTLLRDVGDEASFHDELLTVAPPLRLTSGVQMRF